MKYLDLTLPTPQHNLACDEVLLDLCEDGLEGEILRFWEPLEYFVVLGYSNKIGREINEVSCQTLRIPALRRPSGGGTVLQGPGCLNFSLILKIDGAAPLQSITRTNTYILDRHREALMSLAGPGVKVQGTSDLTVNNLKFSGNAQRRKRRALLFHGTFLCSFDIPLIEKALQMPPKQPDYRQNRTHTDFLTNVATSPAEIKKALKKCWGAKEELKKIPSQKIEELVREKYSKEEWNYRF